MEELGMLKGRCFSCKKTGTCKNEKTYKDSLKRIYKIVRGSSFHVDLNCLSYQYNGVSKYINGTDMNGYITIIKEDYKNYNTNHYEEIKDCDDKNDINNDEYKTLVGQCIKCIHNEVCKYQENYSKDYIIANDNIKKDIYCMELKCSKFVDTFINIPGVAEPIRPIIENPWKPKSNEKIWYSNKTSVNEEGER